ncbi:protein of unknown function [Modestobacter italicus]|uniref:Uncharacterized protein n=1 Tax=Modestobacter italicus (strain DSM 44449 / CECT 9708 / BC 501) TaxID=2732864 RepID=I4EX14_MODI5|nr:hypothetical protein [Modestobacter marinus]CCH87927.1 protein of unknown function [Modestobacter marinus]
MDTMHDTLAEEINVVFSQACIDLARARVRHSEKDTAENRAAVARCRAEIDEVLDWYTASGDHRP